MAEYEHSTTVQASPDALFDFLSDVRNLPQYLPTTRSATAEQGERVRVQGEARGHEYESDGYFRRDQSQKYMEWGSDEGNYSGWLKVRGAGSESNVTIHLSMTGTEGDTQHIPDQDRRVQEGLEAAALSIRNIIEGQGGKVEPASAHEQSA